MVSVCKLFFFDLFFGLYWYKVSCLNSCLKAAEGWLQISLLLLHVFSLYTRAKCV